MAGPQARAGDRRGGPLLVGGLQKSFGDTAVLRGVTFDVTPGRILGFLGRNGAGKTTTMRIIFGLLDPDAGAISLGGIPLDRRIRRSFGYMPEERGLYPRMRVLAQLVHFGRLAGLSTAQARASAMSWLERFGLADRADAKVQELSPGNQQRVQLAVALVHQPRVLVLDEPFSGLDPVGVAEMGQVLREAAAAGSTIVFSSHQLDLVESLCVDIAILHDGVVVEQGDLAQLRERAGSRRVEISVDGQPWLPDIPGSQVVRGEHPSAMVPSSVSVAELLRLASSRGTVTGFRYEPPPLSELFSRAVGQAEERAARSRDEGSQRHRARSAGRAAVGGPA